jgi:hypothetical protein
MSAALLNAMQVGITVASTGELIGADVGVFGRDFRGSLGGSFRRSRCGDLRACAGRHRYPQPVNLLVLSWVPSSQTLVGVVGGLCLELQSGRGESQNHRRRDSGV